MSATISARRRFACRVATPWTTNFGTVAMCWISASRRAAVCSPSHTTRTRYEVIVEGTPDRTPDEGAEWREYGFRGKPGDPARRPPQIAPYHLRLDWLMWFLPLRTVHEEWFYAFLGKLLDADRPTLRLLRQDPFDGGRPRWVRARSFLYRFATRAEFRATGQRWIRMELYEVIAPLSLPRSRSGR